MIPVVAWDIDGTLVDSEPLHQEALTEVCRRWGLDLSDLPNRAFIGVHLRDVWRRISPRLPGTVGETEWLASINSYYATHLDHLILMPGAVETVERLAARGIRQVCVSNSHRVIVDMNLAALGVARHMSYSISLDDVTAGKPDPEPYLAACARLHVEPRLAMAIEDSIAGVRSARTAGLVVVAFAPTGECFTDVDYVVTDLKQVVDLVSEATACRTTDCSPPRVEARRGL